MCSFAVYVHALVLTSLCVTFTVAVIPGTDPTGVADSSAALNRQLRKLCETHTNSVTFAVTILDLESGIYRLESPLSFNASVTCAGPVIVKDGTLLAGDRLDSDRFLVEAVDYIGERAVGMTLTFDHVVFESNFTGGGLLANRSSFTTVSNCNFVHFATYGVWTSGADFRLDRSTLMECTAGMIKCEGPTLKATAMFIDGADSHFNRNVVACTHIGFVNNDGDNFYHQNHIWTNCHPPSSDTGVGDYNQQGFLVMGGSPLIEGSSIDNCHLIITSYRGVRVTNNHFNANARLIIAPPSKPPQNITDQFERCQYWKGAICSLSVVGNSFTCGAFDCGQIISMYTPPQAMQIEISGNAFENKTQALCTSGNTRMGTECLGFRECDTIIRNCSQIEVDQTTSPPSLNNTWREASETVCLSHGFTLNSIKNLRSKNDQNLALIQAGLTPLERARVLSAIENT